MKNLRTLLLITLFGTFVNPLFFSGCTSKYTTGEESEVRSEDGQTVHSSQQKPGKTKKPKEDFIIGFNPFKDDPDNPSPHNPLVKKFGILHKFGPIYGYNESI